MEIPAQITPAWIQIITSLGPTLAGLAALVASLRNHGKINNLKVMVNGRLTQLLETTRQHSFAAGQMQARSSRRSDPPDCKDHLWRQPGNDAKHRMDDPEDSAFVERRAPSESSESH